MSRPTHHPHTHLRFARLLPALLLVASAAPALAQKGSAPANKLGPVLILGKNWRMDVFRVYAGDWDSELTITLTGLNGTGADLYLRQGADPTLTRFDSASMTRGTSNESLLLNGSMTPPLTTGWWHIGVWHGPQDTYDIDYSFASAPSVHSGMGANPYNDASGVGTAFRVWAPNAQSVNLVGSFNGWNASETPMASESGGNWSIDVRNIGAGEEYQFVIKNGAKTLWRNDPRARQLTNSVGNSIVVDPDSFDWGSSSYTTPAWNDMVIYEMHVGTFNDSVGGNPGTFDTALQKLDYLADLGVSVIELMPVCEFPSDFSKGYNYSHPFSVETIYGGEERLKEFVKQAHKRGIAVFLDVLYNHWGPLDMDLWQFDGWSSGGWGGIYFFNDARAQTPWGDTKPDFTRGEVRQYIYENVFQWCDDFRFDGLRWDATSAMRTGPWGDIGEAWSLMQWINDEIDASQGWKLSVAEDMWSNEWITKPTSQGGAGFDSQWDPNFVHPIREELIDADDQQRDMWKVRDALTYTYNGETTQRVIYTESHDEVSNGRSRLPEEIWPGNADSWYSKKRSTLGAAMLLTTPGIPMLFQGQELLEDGYFSDTDPVDWSKLVQFSGIHAMYRDLIQLRRNWHGTTRGLMGGGQNVFHVNDYDKVIAYHRWDQGGQGDDVVVVINMANNTISNYRIGLPRAGLWRVRFNSDASVYDPTFGNHNTPDITAAAGSYNGLPYNGYITLAPYSAIILSQ